VEFDPLAFEWHYQLGNWLRFARRNADRTKPPSSEEIRTLWETYDTCEYEKSRPDGRRSELRNIAFAGVCQGLAEVIQAESRSNRSNYVSVRNIRFGDLKFRNGSEAVNFLMEGVHE
jgi:hypothetical protein